MTPFITLDGSLFFNSELYPFHPTTGAEWTQELAQEFIDAFPVEEAIELPPTPQQPIRVSKIEFRRLLKPKEALWFDLAQTEAPMALEDLDKAFDPAQTTPELQLEAAKRDAIMQWKLLSDIIEVTHPDTAEFLMVMGLCGMFGDDASTRIARILQGLAPE